MLPRERLLSIAITLKFPVMVSFHVLTFPENEHHRQSDNIALKGTKNHHDDAGGAAYPLNSAVFSGFKQPLKKHRKKRCIAVYPEAHIWPIHRIRPFPATSSVS